MKCNVGPTERYVRMASGAAMAGSAFLVDSNWLKLLLGFTGLMEFTTGVTRYCPVSELLGVDNCEGGALKRLTKVESGMTREQAVSIH